VNLPRWVTLSLWGLIAAGVLLRVVPLLLDPSMPLRTCDGHAYWHLAQNLAAGRGLTITDPEVADRLCRLAYGPSHHYSPLLPIVEAGFILVLGPGTWTLVVATEAVTALALATVWWTARDLFGPKGGLCALALMSLEWTTTIHASRYGYAENLVLVTIALTLWAIHRSLKDERWIVLAGLFAGLGYLAKGSVGYFFLVAGGAGFLWRLLHRGWRGVVRPWYGLAILVFASIVGAWTTRNLLHFWDGTAGDFWSAAAMSEPVQNVLQYAGQHPDKVAAIALPKLLTLLLAIVPLAFVFTPQILAGAKRWRDETVSLDLLAILLLIVIGWLIAAAQGVYEHTNPWWGDPIRYVAPARVPLIWVVLRKGTAGPVRWIAAGVLSLLEVLLMPPLLRPHALFHQ